MSPEIVVTNMRTSQRVVYVGCGLVDAVMAAFAQEHGDWNTWQYAERYASRVEVGQWHFFCGDWAVRRA